MIVGVLLGGVKPAVGLEQVFRCLYRLAPSGLYLAENCCSSALVLVAAQCANMRFGPVFPGGGVGRSVTMGPG